MKQYYGTPLPHKTPVSFPLDIINIYMKKIHFTKNQSAFTDAVLKKHEKIIIQNKIMSIVPTTRKASSLKHHVSCHVTANCRNNMKDNTDNTHT